MNELLTSNRPLRVSAQILEEATPEGGAARFLRKARNRLTERSDECRNGRPAFREKYFILILQCSRFARRYVLMAIFRVKRLYGIP